MSEHISGNMAWFKQGLGTRIDSLEVALQGLSENEPDAISTIRQLSQSLVAPAIRFELHDISDASRAVAECSDLDLAEETHALIEILRKQAARARRWSATILIIGGDQSFCHELRALLAGADREVLFSSTAAEAQKILRDKVVVFIILNLFLPDLDGRTMLVRLRENPLTASIPILVMAEKLSQDARADSLFLGVEAFVECPASPEEVADRVRARLRRSHESRKEAHRDPLTGLLNRAACREQFTRVLEACRASQEPLAFGILAIDGGRALMDRHGVRASEAIVQRAASILSSSLRATDILARWGVYKFAAIFPGEDQFGGSRAIDKIRATVRKEDFGAPDGSAFRTSISGGIALASDGDSIDAVIADADRFLFQAQSTGGDRVISDHSRIRRRKERVLVILHDKVTAQVLVHLFKKEGFEVVHVDDDKRGIAAAAGRHRFHLIVVQEEVPERGGFEVLRELRHMPRNNRVPIVMLISRNSPEGIVRALELGANDYVILPFSPLTFMTHMRRLLTRGAFTDSGTGGFQRVLLIDNDTRPLLTAASALHGRGGFHILLAKGAQDALSRLEEESPDAVILPDDMRAPDGRPLVEALQLLPKGQNAAMVLTETRRAGEMEDAQLPSGVVGVLSRPLNPLKLGEELEQILGVPANTRRPPNATDHLNNEIQRIMQRG